MLLTLILLAAIGWSGYWFVGSQTSQSAFETWFDARRAEGWAADYSDLKVQGFPNRFDASFTDVSLADPGTGLAWDAPFFQILALSYQPNHVIAVWPKQQMIATPQGKYKLTSDDMRASIRLEPDTQLALERTTLTAEKLIVTPSATPAPTRADALSLAAERVEGTLATYRLGFSADGLKPSAPWVRLVDPGSTLPDTLNALTADLTVRFDKPWNRSAIEIARPQPRHIRVKLAQASWGQLDLQFAGEVDVDESGQPKGEVTVKAENWREILKLAVASGALPEGLGSTIEDGLGLVAGLSGSRKSLDITLDFRDGRMFLGPVPIGPAPVLTIR
ncbi:DUF2125 domain-containing protein [uncultured Roseovarius sp.]|uniref:DUF2125 domain-containing protein n=1 Tax=uncultured Roseovarius sp. TaxID=293344 RepID=UPI0026126CB0|nr:DUF2125 domain-containing protein [uncultured Roseovarius sp.]